MPPSSVFRQIEDSLEKTLRAIREEFDNPYPVLCEIDRRKFVEEEEDLRKRLEEMTGSTSDGCQWRSLLGFPSPQARKCLQEAGELRKRVRDDINAKLRTRLTGMSSPPPSASLGRGSTPDSPGARTPEPDAGHPPGDSRVRRASMMTMSPLSVDRSLPAEASEVIVYPVVRNDDNSETSSDRSRDSSGRPRRRAPPPPPLSRGIPQSGSSYLASETASNPGSALLHRSHSARRPAPPPPLSTRQSRTPGSPIVVSFPSRGPSFPISVTTSGLTQQVDKLVSSIVHEGSSRQGRVRRTVSVAKSNCVDIRDSNVEGLTQNYGGSYNSGAVIHKTVLPRPV